MRIILRTMDLPGKSAALYRPRKSPIDFSSLINKNILIFTQGQNNGQIRLKKGNNTHPIIALIMKKKHTLSWKKGMKIIKASIR